MTSIMKADIFFFVTTVAVVCVSAAVIVIAVYLARILKRMFIISEKAMEEMNNIVADIRELRGAIREEGTKLKSISEVLMRFAPKNRAPSAKKSSVKEGLTPNNKDYGD